jgi:hypothetical protein
LCVQGLDIVYGLLENGATKEAIEMALDKICELLPTPLAYE